MLLYVSGVYVYKLCVLLYVSGIYVYKLYMYGYMYMSIEARAEHEVTVSLSTNSQEIMSPIEPELSGWLA